MSEIRHSGITTATVTCLLGLAVGLLLGSYVVKEKTSSGPHRESRALPPTPDDSRIDSPVVSVGDFDNDITDQIVEEFDPESLGQFLR